MKRLFLGLLVLLASPAALAAQDDPQPTCKNCPAYYIGNDEIEAYLKRAMANRSSINRCAPSMSASPTSRSASCTAASWPRRERWPSTIW